MAAAVLCAKAAAALLLAAFALRFVAVVREFRRLEIDAALNGGPPKLGTIRPWPPLKGE